jgi:3-oxoacyl-[acyl-carrier-protein] synthase-3
MCSLTSIISTGSYVPENVIKNNELGQFPANAIPLIEKKTGVKERRFADKSQCTSDLAIEAANRCLEKVHFKPDELDVIILATSSPDRMQPATATRVQMEIGADRAYAFDINSVCSGGIYAIHIADSLIKSGSCENILVVASEMYSKYLNPTDFSTYPYFGDGAGAVLVSENQDSAQLTYTSLGSDGSGQDVIQIPAGGTMMPFYDVQNQKDIYFKMRGKEVYEFVIEKGTEIVNKLIQDTGINKNQIKFVISHQANINLIRKLSDRTGIDYDKWFVNLDRYGNTAGASVFIGLDELLESKKLENNDMVILVAFGGGFSWGAALIKM